jgi:hypothetical protein
MELRTFPSISSHQQGQQTTFTNSNNQHLDSLNSTVATRTWPSSSTEMLSNSFPISLNHQNRLSQYPLQPQQPQTHILSVPPQTSTQVQTHTNLVVQAATLPLTMTNVATAHPTQQQQQQQQQQQRQVRNAGTFIQQGQPPMQDWYLYGAKIAFFTGFFCPLLWFAGFYFMSASRASYASQTWGAASVLAVTVFNFLAAVSMVVLAILWPFT